MAFVMTLCGTLAIASTSSASELSSAIASDVSADRGWLLPTAHAQPEGSWSVMAHQLVFVSVTHAPAVDWQVSIGGHANPWEAEGQYLVTGTVKRSFRPNDALATALQIGAAHYEKVGENRLTAATMAGVATWCWSRSCGSSLTGFAQLGATRVDMTPGDMMSTSEKGPGATAALGLSATISVARHARVVAETFRGFSTQRLVHLEHLSASYYGVRVTSSRVSGDLGLVIPASGSDGYFFGLPWLALTWRFP